MKKIILLLWVCLAAFGIQAQTSTEVITLDGLVDPQGCNIPFFDNSGVQLMFTQTTNEDACPGACFYGIDPTSVWLYPARLVVDLSFVLPPAFVTSVEVDILDWTNPPGSMRAFLYDPTGVQVAYAASTVSYISETLVLPNPILGPLSNLAVSACEGQVFEIRVYIDPGIGGCGFTVNETITNVSCFGGSNGAVDLTVTGGATPYSFAWSNGASTEDISGLTAGTYDVTVTDASGCTETFSYPVLEPPEIVVLGSVTHATTSTSMDGSIDISVSGGAGLYSYSWSTGATTEDLINIPAGSYTVSVYDSNQCLVESFFDVFYNTGPITNGFNITLNETGVPVAGGGTGYYNDPTYPNNYNGWYNYTVTDWWNIWFYNGYDANKYKTITIEFDLTVYNSNADAYLDFAVNWSTDIWYNQGIANVPPLPSLVGNSEADFISRPTLQLWDQGITSGHYVYNYIIPNYCPGYVSIDVQGYNFEITNGVIIHECVSGTPSLGACCIPSSQGYTCTETTETNCLASGGQFMGVGTSCSTNPCPVENTFGVSIPSNGVPSSDPTVTYGTGAFPGGINGWYDYPSGWWNIWFYDHPYDATRYKEVHVSFIVSPIEANVPTYLDFAVNWSTAEWSLSPLAVYGPPVPQFMGAAPEDLYIERPIILNINSVLPIGSSQLYDLCLYVTDYNPEWVSIDVIGSNVEISNGYIWHACLPGPPPTEVDLGPDIEICEGDCVTLTATGGASYQWSTGGTGSSINVCPTTTTTYSVTATDANGCFLFDRVTVIVNPNPVINLICTDITCYGYNDGSISAYVSGGTPGYTYAWSDGSNASSLSGLGAGTYTLTVTDSKGCTATASCTINEPSQLDIYYVSIVGLLCHGDQTGVISLGVTGGTTPYSYAWSDGQTGATATGLGAGTYTFTVTDYNNCTATGTATIDDPPGMTITMSSTNVSCYGYSDGSASASVSGGTPGYSYIWSTGASTAAISNLSAGVYILSVYDANQCLETTSVTITEPQQLTVVMNCVDITCYGYNDGHITVSVSGGTSPYTIAWSPNISTSTSANNLLPGLYKITVTDANSCTVEDECTINEPALLTVAMSKTDVICFGYNDGTATATPSGGTPGYSYAWSNGLNTQTISNIGPGVYSVIVTDTKGCTANGSVGVNEPTALAGNVTVTNVTCPNGSDGTATANINGGTLPYIYFWNGVVGGATINGLSAGNHTLMVKDDNNCTFTIAFVITQPPPITITSVIVNVDCYGNSTGSATVTAAGGTGGYTYFWPGYGAGPAITGVPAGSYTVQVTDANNCLAVFTIVITEPPALVLSATSINPSATGASDGSIDLTVGGGTPLYGYVWSNGAFTQDINNLAAGTYCVTVTDANNCVATLCVTLVDPVCPSTNQFWIAMGANSTPDPNPLLTGGTYYYPGGINGWHNYPSGWWNIWFCNLPYNPNAYKTVTIEFDLSMDVYSYIKFALNWTTPLWDTQTSTTGPPLPTEFVTGISESQYIMRPTLLETDDYQQNVHYTFNYVIPEYCPGWVSIDVQGFNFQITNGVITHVCETEQLGQCCYFDNCIVACDYISEDDCNLLNGEWDSTLTCNDACTLQALDLSLTGTNPLCAGSCDGTITANVSGGVAPYTLAWLGTSANLPNALTPYSITNLCAGTYTVSVTDAIGCTATATVTLVDPASNMTLYLTTYDPDCYGDSSGKVIATVFGGTPPLVYNWSTGATGALLLNVPAGTYGITVIDANGCTITGSATLIDPPLLIASIVGTNPSYPGATDGAADLTVTGGTPPYGYLWDTGDITEDISGLSAGTYCVTVTDNNGCIATACVTLVDIVCPSTNQFWIGMTSNNYPDPLLTGGTDFYPGGVNGWYDYPSGWWNIWFCNLPFDTLNYKQIHVEFNMSVLDPAMPFYFRFAVNWSTPAWDLYNLTMPPVPIGPIPVNENLYIVREELVNTDNLSASGFHSYDFIIPNYCPGWVSIDVQGFNFKVDSGIINHICIDEQLGQCCYWDSCTVACEYVSEDDCNLLGGVWDSTLTCADNCPMQELVVDLSGTNPLCFGDCNGEITAYIGGGVPPYTITWLGITVNIPVSINSYTISNLCAGTYAIVVTDAIGCSITQTITLVDPPPLVLSITGTNPTAPGAPNGTVDLTVGGGTPPYNYLWNTGDVTEDLSGLIAGTYCVVVTDFNGCQADTCITLVDPVCVETNQFWIGMTSNNYPDPLLTGGTDYYPGGINGWYDYPSGWWNIWFCNLPFDTLNYKQIHVEFNMSVLDPAMPFYFRFAVNWTTPAWDLNNPYMPPVPIAGTVIDESMFIVREELVNTDNLSASGFHSYDFIIPNYCPGWVSIDVQGFNFKVDSGIINHVCVQEQLGQCCYFDSCDVVCEYITDSECQQLNGQWNANLTCADSCLLVPLSVSSWGDNNDCNGDTAGVAYVSATGGLTPYTYLWSNGETTSTIYNLPAGTYYATITDAAGCVKYATIIIWEPLPVSVVLSTTNVTCFGYSDGTATATVSGGTSPYLYYWDGVSGGSSIAGLSAGNYTFEVVDANNCSVGMSFIITEPLPIVLAMAGFNPTAPGASDGSIDLTVSGGTSPYLYLWSNGATTEDITGLPAGTYCVTVTDSNGCPEDDCITLVDPVCPETNQFWIGMTGNYYPDPALTGGTDYYPGGVNGWFDYPSGWWNIWFCNLPFDTTKYKQIHVEFNLSVLTPGQPFYVQFAVNWSTPAWDINNPNMPPLPSNSVVVANESTYIYREILVDDDNISITGFHSYDFIIPEYCPGWVSIDVQGFNFKVDNGIINHVCMQDPLGQCCYVEQGDVMCAYVTEADCNLLDGYWDSTKDCNDICLIPAPWGDPINTGDNHTILVPDTTPITIDGVQIGYGDEIAVFYDSLGTLIVAGTRTWTETSTIVVAWGDDAQTTEPDGFASGEVFKWMIWDASEAEVYDAYANYYSGYPNTDQYAANGISALMSLEARPCQTLELTNGWDMISTYIDPTLPDVAIVMSPVVVNLTIMKDENGLTYWPTFNLNMIGNWTPGEAYQIKMTANDTLDICGSILDPATTAVDMPAGWSRFGFLCQTNQLIVDMLSPIVTDIILIKDAFGNVYWPMFNLDMIVNMIPGDGYQAKMSSANQLYYSCSGSTKAMIVKPTNQHFEKPVNTGNNMTLGIPTSAWDKLPEQGDEVAVFTLRGELVGSSVYTGNHIAIPVWGDDEYTAHNEALQADENFVIRLWHHESGKEEVLEVESWLEGNDQYSVDGISIAEKIISTGVDGSSYVLYQNIPNPFKETTEIRFYLPKASSVQLDVYNLLGEKVAKVIHHNFSEGAHSVIFESDKLRSGSYYYKLQTPDFSATRSMSIIR